MMLVSRRRSDMGDLDRFALFLFGKGDKKKAKSSEDFTRRSVYM